MLAFIDNPIALMVIFVGVLVLFGPQKLPEIANQLGRAIRELKRSTSELSSSLSLDEDRHRYDSHYDPPKYDSYGNAYDTPTTSVPEEDLYHGAIEEKVSAPALEPMRGDFAASALSDDPAGMGVTPVAPAASETSGSVYGVLPTAASKEFTPRPPESSVPRA